MPLTDKQIKTLKPYGLPMSIVRPPKRVKALLWKEKGLKERLTFSQVTTVVCQIMSLRIAMPLAISFSLKCE